MEGRRRGDRNGLLKVRRLPYSFMKMLFIQKVVAVKTNSSHGVVEVQKRILYPILV